MSSKGLVNLTGEISIVESDIKSGKLAAAELEKANYYLSSLKNIQVKLVRNNDIIQALDRGANLHIHGAYQEEYHALTRAFENDQQAVWDDPKGKLFWSFIGESMDWYDATGSKHLNHQVPKRHTDEGCTLAFGSSWTTPSIEQVESLTSQKGLLASIGESHPSLLKRPVWLSNEFDADKAYVFNLRAGLEQVKEKLSLADVVCVLRNTEI